MLGRQFGPAGTEFYLTARLIPEPHNKHDRNAVSVRLNGSTVGYLPREEAVHYARVLSALVAQGWLPQVGARVWGGERTSCDYDRRGRTVDRTEFIGSVRLDLAAPHLKVPTNQPPTEAYALLPRGNAIQVTGEEDHMARLVPLLSPSGEGWIHATVHEVVEQGPRSSRTLAEVRIDGAVIGKLSPKMSTELLPVVHHLAARGALTACRAILKGNSLGADVVLYAARANELPQEWLDAPPVLGKPPQITAVAADDAVDRPVTVAEAATTPDPVGAGPHPAYAVGGTTSWHFNAPPGWPPPPEGWSPPPGWQPDPSWPPAPPGWQFWTAGSPRHQQAGAG